MLWMCVSSMLVLAVIVSFFLEGWGFIYFFFFSVLKPEDGVLGSGNHFTVRIQLEMHHERGFRLGERLAL